MDGLLESRAAAEGFDQFHGGSHGGEGGDPEDLRIVQVGDAVVLVFLEDGLQHGAGLIAVLGEDVSLADIVGPLPAGEGRPVEGYVADEIEWIQVSSHLFGQRFQKQAFLGQFVDHRLLAFGLLPAP
jgi:hypothetical protein